MSSPRDDVEDIDALVSDFVEKKGHSSKFDFSVIPLRKLARAIYRDF